MVDINLYGVLEWVVGCTCKSKVFYCTPLITDISLKRGCSYISMNNIDATKLQPNLFAIFQA